MKIENLRRNAGILFISCSALALFINLTFQEALEKISVYNEALHNGFVITLSCMILIAVGLCLIDIQNGPSKAATSLLNVSLPAVLFFAGHSLALLPFAIWIGVAIGTKFFLDCHKKDEANPTLKNYIIHGCTALLIAFTAAISSYFILSGISYCSSTIIGSMTKDIILGNVGVVFCSMIISQLLFSALELITPTIQMNS